MLTQLGKYRIDRVLGTGAMGVVYQAFDTQIQRTVALKTIRTELLADQQRQEVLARFKNEAQASGRLFHPNIVVVYDFGELDRTVYLVMEFVSGAPLNQFMVVDKPMSVQDTISCMAQLLGALEHSHQHGVVHRDIKPANLLITRQGQLKITDFGSARLEHSELTHMGAMMGTPSYMSPELLRGQTVDARSDVFAAGIVLYQLLTGKRPFSGVISAVLQQILHDNPVSPSQHNAALPTEFDAIVERALAKDPAQRYASAQAFLDTLLAVYQAHQVVDSDCTILANCVPNQTAPSAEPSSGSVGFSTLTPWKNEVFSELQTLLALQVGPIAKVLLKNALTDSSDFDEVCLKLLPHIPDEAGRAQFMAGGLSLKKKSGLNSSDQGVQGVPLLVPELVAVAEQKLTVYIGPIAKVLVKKAAKQTQDKPTFFKLLADNIANEKQRKQFLRDLDTV